MNDYHTALRSDNNRWPRLDRFKGIYGIAFQADINNGIPIAMHEADVWYSDIPWRDGYKKFSDRAGIEQIRPYTELLERLGREIMEISRPTVLITGKHAVRYLLPESTVKVILNGSSAVACLWGRFSFNGMLNTVDILKSLACEYQCIGDFCCGYGRAGKIFAQAGKRYVMSDLNPECVGYIAAHERGWV